MLRESAPLLLGALLGALALALGLVLWGGLRGWWRAWRYGTPIDHATLLVEYGRRMTGAPDRRALADLLTIELPRALQTQEAVLLLPEGHDLVTRRGEGELCIPVSHAAGCFSQFLDRKTNRPGHKEAKPNRTE